MSFEENEFNVLLENALNEAALSNKKVLLEFGGDWCIWSHRMEKAFNCTQIKPLVDREFVLLRCHIGDDGSCEFPFDIVDIPEFSSVPFFVLLDGATNVVAYSGSEEFEFLWFYKKGKIAKMLREWSSLPA